MILRLRQLCLAAARLEPVVDALCAVFGGEVCHRDPAVARFGLHNALVPFGTSFIEVVAPLKPGTAAGRFLERRGGDGGYMVILDSADLAPWRAHVHTLGVRIAFAYDHGDYQGVQLHPRDTGGALLEINHTRGGESLRGAYGPAGPGWQRAAPSERVRGIRGAVLQSALPEKLARRWGEILQKSVERTGPDGWRLALDNAALRFIPDADRRGDGLAAIVLAVADASAIRSTAAERGCLDAGGTVVLGGVRFFLEDESA